MDDDPNEEIFDDYQIEENDSDDDFITKREKHYSDRRLKIPVDFKNNLGAEALFEKIKKKLIPIQNTDQGVLIGYFDDVFDNTALQNTGNYPQQFAPFKLLQRFCTFRPQARH